MTNIHAIRPQAPEPAAGTFEEFWQACPALMRQRADKDMTEIIWTEITNGGRECRTALKEGGQVMEFFRIPRKATPEEIMSGLKRYLELHYDPQTFKYDRFLCGATRFLNSGGWKS